MFNTNNGYSLSDIAAATGGDGFMGGNGGAWWIIILFLFCFMGWGGNGFGTNGSAPYVNGTTTREEIGYGFDMANVKASLADVNKNVVDGFYAINTGLLNGFASDIEAVNSGTRAIQSDICNLGMSNLQNTNTITNAINAQTMGNAQNTFGLMTQLNSIAAQQAADTCETQKEIASNAADFNYNLASLSCQTRQTVNDGVRDIMENSNNNTRAILDFLVQSKMDSLSAENAALRSTVSQAEQSAYLLSQLRPQANPAYIVSNPYSSSSCGCGYGIA